MPGGTLNQGTGSISTATQLVAANDSRKVASIQPLNGDAYIGPSGVATSTGIFVAQKAVAETEHDGAIHVVAAAGTVDFRFWDES
jgi:hypothetical protein